VIANIAGGTFIVCCMASFICFDLILLRQYETAREQWEADGRPPGFFWVPEGTSRYFGMRERDQQLRRWMFGTPEWASMDKRARLLFRIQRVLMLVAISAWTLGVWQMFFGPRY